jgi:hypothetical protein
MPVVFRHKGFRFYFFSNEGNPREPVHIHVMKDGIDAKFWLWPDVVVAYNDGFGPKAMHELIEIVSHRRQFLTSAWNEFFGESD